MLGAQGLSLMVACYAAGALSSALSRFSARWAIWLGHLGVVAGAISGATVALGRLASARPAPLSVDLPALFPFARMSLSIDGLSAFFLLVVSLVAVAAGIYGPAYLRAHAERMSAAASAVHVLALNVFVGSMALLCCAGDALSFLLLWEGMTLASFALVVSETGSDEHAQAGVLYIVMAHIGTALLIFVFLALVDRAGSFDFQALREAAQGLTPAWRSNLFFLALFGFAAKAGVVPLHVWLPYAHPVAPSHVSALMSGVMLKVAVYGIFRFGFDLLSPAGPAPPSWGWTVLLLGVVSALIGVLYALQQHDLKRLLAFHSVENVGIILIGAGVALLLGKRGGAAASLATVALVGALLHTINHATFKGLLFLGAGSVLSRTHQRNMEELGGLARRMPFTAWMFLIGAVAISALPPLNGFVSEWLTFQALVLGGGLLGGASGLVAVFAASMLALTGGLAAACFVKAFGATFLGRPRSTHAEAASEAPASMLVAMAILAALCVLLGILPGYAVALLEKPTSELLGAPGAAGVVGARGPLVLATGSAAEGLSQTAISVTGVALLFAGLLLAAWIVRAWPRAAGRRLEPTWTCGMTPTSRFDYTATSFAKSLRLIFAMVYRPHRQLERETGASPYEVRRLHYSGDVVDLAEIALYRRVQHWIGVVSRSVRARSTGRIHAYIGFVLVTLFVTLLVFGGD